MDVELLRNTDVEIPLIVTKEMITDFVTEILIHKGTFKQELLLMIRSEQFITAIILLLLYIVFIYIEYWEKIKYYASFLLKTPWRTFH